jgi:hypothetical protein
MGLVSYPSVFDSHAKFVQKRNVWERDKMGQGNARNDENYSNNFLPHCQHRTATVMVPESAVAVLFASSAKLPVYQDKLLSTSRVACGDLSL